MKLAAPLLCLVLTLAGCAEPSDPSPAEDSDPAPTDPGSTNAPVAPAPEDSDAPETLPWELHDCFFMYSNALADAAAVQASLPEGFTVQTGQGGRVGVGFETNVCTSGSGLNGTVDGQTYATAWIGVTPPDHLQAENGAFHVFHFEVLVQDEPRRTWMQERGMPALDGSITTLTNGPLNVITLDLGGNEFVFNIGELQPAANSGGVFDQWTPGSQGLTYWRTEWATRGQSTGVGTVQIPAGSIYADWFEVPVVPAQFNIGVWDYTNGRLVHPAPTAP